MPSLVLEATWANAGATVIIYLAALTGVNPELYEAASVDGARLWRKVWNVTLPQIRGVLLVTLILQIIGTAQVFLEPFLFTSGGPANATLTVLLLVHRVHRSDRRLSDLPALVPAEFRPRRRDQGLVAEPMCTAYAPPAPDDTQRHRTTRTGTNGRRHGVEQGPEVGRLLEAVLAR